MSEPTSYVAVGQRIRAAREVAGMSQEQLAKIMGVTGATISRYESAKSRVPVTDLVRLAAVLNASPTYLLTGDRESEQEDVIWQYLALAKNDRESVRQFIDFLHIRRLKAIEAA